MLTWQPDENNIYIEELLKLVNFYRGLMNINDNVVISMSLEKNEINITSIINNEYQYFFVNKLEEFNITTGQQQIEAHDQLINIFKNKNKEERLEILKKTNIQKCIQWCEKYKIPYNKFSEMFNIFLPSRNENTNTLQEINLKSENFVEEIKSNKIINYSRDLSGGYNDSESIGLQENIDCDSSNEIIIEDQIETPICEREMNEIKQEIFFNDDE